jgi:uncharacterized protein (TIGR03437 family)
MGFMGSKTRISPGWLGILGIRALLPLLVLATARAQFAGLSCTDDGGRVFFASSLRQRGTDQFLWSKIFRIDASGAALVAQRAQSSPVPPTNPYVLDQPQVSGDGRLLVYRGTLNCGCCSSCFLSEQHSTTMLDTTTGQESYVGPNARISRNGRYLVSYTSSENPAFPQGFSLVDRSSSATLFEGTFRPATVSIASDGTTVLAGSALQLLRAGNQKTLVDSNVNAAVINDSATTVIYETRARRLFVLDLKSAQTQQLGPDDRDSSQATLSSDGQWVAYLSTLGVTPQVFISRLDGSAWKQLTAWNDGIVEVTLSGDGKTVFAVTVDGSMLRIDTTTGRITTLVGPTPTMRYMQGGTAGSLASIQGAGLGDASISISGLTAPILRRSANQILFQVPWEAPLSADAVTIPEGGSPYFDDAIRLILGDFAPEVLFLAPQAAAPSTQPFAIHSDWGSLVTDDNPAAPGEIVHMYLTRGGPVSPPLATGAPAPLEPLSPITTPIYVAPSGDEMHPLQVHYFGLAPGLIGIWQMDITLPSVWSRPFLSINIASSPVQIWSLPAIPMKTGS